MGLDSESASNRPAYLRRVLELSRIALIRYRLFRNSDPQGLAEIWCSQAPGRGLMQPMSVELFEQHVLSKPYFDNAGLVVALDGEMLVGFGHAGFGPDEREERISARTGVVCMVQVRPNYHRQGIGAELLRRSEEYLRSRGSEVLFAGGVRPYNPFYLGLYGGSEMSGILDSDVGATRLYRAGGYREVRRWAVMHRELADFHPPIDRAQVLLRRRFDVTETFDPLPATWWEACTMGAFDIVRAELRDRHNERVCGSATIWSMGPLAASWGVHAAGLVDVKVDESLRRQGLATIMLTEMLRRLQSRGISLVETQAPREDPASQQLFEKLGFREVDQGAVYRKG